LIQASDGNLYGTTSRGGTDGDGVIYKVVLASAGTLQWGASAYSVDEDAGSLTIHVSRAAGSAGAATVVASTSGGTAKSGTDYSGLSETLSWADGDSSQKAFTIPIKDLGLTDGSTREFTVKLASPTGASLGTPSTATITIKENDPTEGELRFVSSAYSVDETAGTVTVHVERVVGKSGAVSVKCATSSGTAKSGTDYVGKSETLSWATGESGLKNFIVTIDNRGTSGGGGLKFSVLLSAPAGGAILTSPETATVTID
jgi:uncharacterized repeat protein (TIGR03803 family)